MKSFKFLPLLLSLIFGSSVFAQPTAVDLLNLRSDRMGNAAASRQLLNVGRMSHVSDSVLLSNNRASSGSGITSTYRQRYYIDRDCPFIEVTWFNYCIPEVNLDPMLIKAAWDYGASGATMSASIPRKDIYFPNGSSSWTLNWRQSVTARVYGPFFAGDYVWIRTYLEQAASKFYPVGTALNNNGEGVLTTDQIATANSSVTFTSNSARNNFGPTLVTAPDSNGKKAVLIVGDSIMDGAGEDVASSNKGFGVRACDTLGYSSYKVALAGDRAGAIVPQMGYRCFGFEYSDWALCEYGTNDIGIGDSWSTVATNLIKVWRQLKTCNLKVVQTTILPKVTTTDFCLTIANQTQTAYESQRVLLNTWLRNGCQVDATGAPVQSGGTQSAYIDKVCDVCAVVEVNASNVLTQNGGYWQVYAAAFSGTVTASSSSSITDSTAPFTATSTAVVGDRNRNIVITSGTGIGQIRNISSATTTVATVATTFTTTPPVGSTYSVYDSNSYDGTHPYYKGHVVLSAPVARALKGDKSTFLVAIEDALNPEVRAAEILVERKSQKSPFVVYPTQYALAE